VCVLSDALLERRLSDSPVAVSRPPLLGEHTDALLELLCEPDEAKRLRQEGGV
jgi:formyl-CoA transferase